MYLGIDPGSRSGAIVALDDQGLFAGSISLAETPHDVADFIFDSKPKRALLERVSSMPGQGVASSFKFGASYGMCLGLLAGLKVQFRQVAPSKWQQKMHCRTKGDKRVSKRKAQELWPGQKITLDYADAFLLAECCRLQWEDLA